MRKKTYVILIFLCFCVSLSWSQGIRKAICAGTFYDGRAEMLSRQIDIMLQNAKRTPVPLENVAALIAPHAAYVCSGQVAASAYRLALGKDYETIIIIGISHHHGFNGCSIYPQGGYETPLGIVEINEPLALELTKASGFKYISQAHKMEHSVEVQIPFIQKTLPKAKIVPIVMGFQTKKTITALASALSEVLPGEKALVIASTDLSHFLPKKSANDIDSKTISLIQSLKINTLLRKVERGENIMCGGGPVLATLLYAKKRGKANVEFLDYGDSTRCVSEESRVVGYYAAALYLEDTTSKFSLSSEERKELLRLARSAIQQFIQEDKIVNYQTQNVNFLTKKGAFVTLKKKGGLRGCIGYIDAVFPLYQTIIKAAIEAAYKDTRFPPLSAAELMNLKISISVLSPLKKIHNPKTIEVGKHGLFMCKGNKRGLLLPQVPVENHWSRETFLQQACLKAGLPPNAWKSGADIYIFEAIVFE